jgi:APA family basic amino acid/polyamine antiporter
VREPNLKRNFKVPALPVIAVSGILINTFLMYKLEPKAQILSLGWLLIGLAIYFLYSKNNSKLNK